MTSRVSKVLTIANAATTSDVMDARSSSRLGLSMPAAFTGVSISFLVCDTYGGTYQALYTAANALVSVTIGLSRSYNLPTDLTPWPFFKVVSSGAEGAQRLITVVGASD